MLAVLVLTAFVTTTGCTSCVDTPRVAEHIDEQELCTGSGDQLLFYVRSADLRRESLDSLDMRTLVYGTGERALHVMNDCTFYVSGLTYIPSEDFRLDDRERVGILSRDEALEIMDRLMLALAIEYDQETLNGPSIGGDYFTEFGLAGHAYTCRGGCSFGDTQLVVEYQEVVEELIKRSEPFTDAPYVTMSHTSGPEAPRAWYENKRPWAVPLDELGPLGTVYPDDDQVCVGDVNIVTDPVIEAHLESFDERRPRKELHIHLTHQAAFVAPEGHVILTAYRRKMPYENENLEPVSWVGRSWPWCRGEGWE